MPSDTAPKQIGNYEILSKIAEGGMGAVYKAKHARTGDLVAIKIIPADTAKNPVLLKRFEQEFRAASLFDHPNIVKAIEYCGTVTTPFLVMEFVDGESLGQRVERAGAMEEAEAVNLIVQVCDGLHRAHKQGLVHRDVKPDNILLTADGVAKLTDMGLVKDVEGELNLTKTGRGLGTPHFMAPEQFRDAKNADVRCDIYSLGATLYMLVTAIVPFAKTNPLDCWLKKTKNDFELPNKINKRLSERVNRAILRAMSADPTRRPASCREFVEELTGQPWTTRAGTAITPQVVPPSPDRGTPPTNDLWYMVYRDENNQPKTVKGSTARILENLKSGTLGDPSHVLVCRTKAGPFVPIREMIDFRVYLTEPKAIEPKPSVPRAPIVPPPPVNTRTASAPPPRPATASDPATYAPTRPEKVLPLRASKISLDSQHLGEPLARPSILENKFVPWVVIGGVILSAIVIAIIFSR